jgi:hypothetical protein
LKDFPQSNKADNLKNQLETDAKDDQKNAQKGLDQASQDKPAPGSIPVKQAQPLTPEQPGAHPQVNANGAVPDGRTPAETSLDQGPKAVNDQMSQNDPPVTEQMLQNSNEPSFQQALGSKKDLEQHSQQAPVQYKQQEQALLNQTQGQVQNDVNSKVATVYSSRNTQLNTVAGDQKNAKAQNEAARQDIAAKIQTIYDAASKSVNDTLKALPDKVSKLFDDGSKAASDHLKTYIQGRIDALKDSRENVMESKDLLDFGGKIINNITDHTVGIPDNMVKPIYEDGKKQYIAEMTQLAQSIATVIDIDLGKAKQDIANGKQNIENYINTLPQDQQQIGRDAAEQMDAKFDQLGQDVDNAVDKLQQDMTDKFTKAGQDADALIKKMQDDNKTFLQKAADAVGGVLETINQLKDMLLGVLAKAASVIGQIIADPIRFLGNLLNAIGQGLHQFVNNIGQHLEQGLIGWLTGTLGSAGIELPSSLTDLPGIFKMVMGILGITYDGIKAKAVKLIGRNKVERLEQGAEAGIEIFQVVKNGGIGKLWNFINQDLGDIGAMVFNGIKEWLIGKVIQKGIELLLSMLTPASAFIEACRTIVSVIQSFIERASQIMEFVNSILDSIAAIVAGNIGAAANAVEQSLAKALPLAISFLASLFGLDDIVKPVKVIIGKIQKFVDKAIDKILKTVVSKVKGLFGGGSGSGRSHNSSNRSSTHHDHEQNGDKQEKVDAGLKQLDQQDQSLAHDGKLKKSAAKKAAARVKADNPVFSSIKVIDAGDRWDYDYAIARMTKKGLPKEEVNNGIAKGGTYLLIDTEGLISEEKGTVVRTGRTNDLVRRENEHGRDENLKNFKFEVDRRTDEKDAQRGREQIIHDLYNHPVLNKIRPISLKNKKIEHYLKAGKALED